jgi:hypothetical protein
MAKMRKTSSDTAAHEPAKGMKNGSHQLKVKGKNIIEVLGVEFERVDIIDCAYRMNGGVAIERGHGPKGLFFAYLADDLAVTLDCDSAF